jgi:hypothetical protein
MAVVNTAAAVSTAAADTPEAAFMETVDIAAGASMVAGAVTAEVVAMAADAVVEDNRQTLQS